ncbi:extracellular solute-binding protein [Spongiactinospora sp. TRM90649]|uniref:extracellular solute-binding protein n=1 Tax=Spongiactinospora sp. TRM90649 TaxID=3031114 RepID=UPI0023F8F0D3|nr:extracellular solute-binding protein [Spongiactinospora sp. TRM90649]MDF5753938.1 extracellular solute-binding protein [Spongiactinospora sp. TRM90649]
MRRGRRMGAFVCAGGLALGACTGAGAESAARPAVGVTAVAPTRTPTPSPSPTPSISEGEGILTVLSHRGYAEWGGSDPKVNWVGPFEKKTGCRVTRLDHVRNAEELHKAYDAGSYDVVAASPEAAGRLIAEGKAGAIDTALLPRYGDMPKRLRTLPAYDRDGKVYGVPFLWEVAQLGHDTREPRPRGLSGLFGAKTSAVEDDPLSLATAALALKKDDPDLDIDDPFQLTPAQLDRATALLAERDGDGREYWTDPLDVVSGFAAGAVSVAQTSPYVLSLLRRAGRPVRPASADPATGRADAWMLSANAQHPGCAYRWLEWMSGASVQRDAAAWNGKAPANPKACTGRAGRVCSAYRVGDDDWLDKVVFATRPARDCGTKGKSGCTDYTEWERRWRELVD